MPEFNNLYVYKITEAGDNLVLDVIDRYSNYYLVVDPACPECTTTVSLLDNLTISTTGSPCVGDVFNFKYAGGVDLNGFDLQIFGTSLTASQALINLNIECLYTSDEVWRVLVTTDSTSGVKSIDGNSIVNGTVKDDAIEKYTIAVDKFAKATSLSGGIIYRSDPFGVIEEFDVSGNAKILIGNGENVGSVSVTGDVHISGAGVTTIQPAVITTAMLNFVPMTYYEAEISLTSAQILALNTTPIEIIGTPGAGKYIDLISATWNYTYNTAVYATNTSINLINTGGASAILVDDGALISSVNKIGKFIPKIAPPAATSWMSINSGISVTVDGGDPTAGAGTIKISIVYRIVNA